MCVVPRTIAVTLSFSSLFAFVSVEWLSSFFVKVEISLITYAFDSASIG